MRCRCWRGDTLISIERISEEDNRLIAVAFLKAIEEENGENDAEQHIEKESLLDQQV